MRSVNEKKAKVLRRAATEMAQQKPDLHDHYARYTEIVRTFEDPRTGKKFERRQVVLASGVRLIYRRLKRAYRRGLIRVTSQGVIQTAVEGTVTL